MDVSLSLGKRIRELRMRMGLSQVELAQGICTPSMISQIESDRARPSYKILFALAERLEVPLEKLLVDADVNLAYTSTYKMAKAMVSAQQHAAAIPLLQELLATPRTQIPSVEILYKLAECYLQLERLPEAEQTLTTTHELAVLRMDHHMLALVRKLQGLVEYKRKRYKLAVFHWQQGSEEAGKMTEPDALLQAELQAKIGLACVMLGQMAEAYAHYTCATSLYQGIDRLADIGTAYMKLGLAYKKHNELEKVAEYSERAVSIFDALENVLQTWQLQVQQAVLYGQTGRCEEAALLLEAAIGKFQELGRSEEEGLATVELAKIKQQSGAFPEAEQLCRRAKRLLPPLHLYQGWVNRILGRVAFGRKQGAEAIRQLQRAAAVFRKREEYSEWDNTMAELATVYRTEQDLGKACQILSEIREHRFALLEKRGVVM